ncbi:MAG: hypothetical protein M3Z25_11675 [Actinomycetota bacterium]|nr:hypothetical protein [Actinomycetota bacterium]
MIATPALVCEAAPRIAAIGPGFYFTDETIAVGREHGLDGFRFYFLGRGGVLGDVEADVVTSAFGYFTPALVSRMWTTARERTSLSARDAGRLYLRCSQEFGRRHLSEVAGLAEFCAAAEQVNDAADRAGLALYAGTAAEPLVDDLPARAMQLNTVLREFRGSAHLVAILATPGITPRLAHGIRRPDFWTLFGYEERDLPVGTDAQRAALATADELTDAMVAPAFDVLDEARRVSLLDGLVAIEAALPEWVMPGR